MSELFSYKIILEPAEEGGYTVYVPSLPGCISEGDTKEEAKRKLANKTSNFPSSKGMFFTFPMYSLTEPSKPFFFKFLKVSSLIPVEKSMP